MATILLSAVGASIGSGLGGSILGLSGAVVGRAVGATVGRMIDQRLLGGGARAVETGRIDRLRLQSAGEGTPIARLWGQMRLPGHVIWAAPLEEVRRTESAGGGKGGGGPRVTEVSYLLSAAFALCEGVIGGVGRIWADGEEVDPDELNLRVYRGDEAQLPDPCIAAHMVDEAPAYRGIAYVVVERLSLERWGNRVPQLSFEVTRAVLPGGTGLASRVEAVAMIPGTGEYTLATSPVGVDLGLGETRMVNRTTAGAATDFQASMKVLGIELPRVKSVSLVVSWFGDDLRCAQCQLRPKVENVDADGAGMPWRAGGITRAQAQEVVKVDGKPVYGGTPADASVIEALRAITASGRKAVFYPFILMEQLAGNGKTDPWTGAPDQPVLPWRGRITCSVAPGLPGSPDNSIAAQTEVQAFFGTCKPHHFSRANGIVSYSGPDEWSYRRFILHYAHLCAEAGGVDTFVIGSEMAALTRVRRNGTTYTAVNQLKILAGEVRAILGPSVKLTYAADWTEYFGDNRGGGELRYHLDPLWADDSIDVIGIDNYLPLSDWRDGEDHADAGWGSILDPAYLRANVAGGELYDWYYADPAHREAQIRTPITDGLGEPWVWRVKDIRNWWENPHFDRLPGGEKRPQASAWVPRSKPVWFTEMGCAALDKATNQPNKFLDAMSSESSLPYYSDGRRDDGIQAAYVQAMTGFWSDPANNPTGTYGGPMVDMSRAHVWCWDARPYPAFPARTDLWSDGPAWSRGHWLTGRAGAVPLADVVRDLCRAAGIGAVDVSGLTGVVRGFVTHGGETARAALQTLMLAQGFDVIETGGTLRFRMRDGRVDAVLGPDDLAATAELSRPELARAPEAEMAGRVRLSHVEAGTDYETVTAEAMLPDDGAARASDSEVALALTRAEGRAVAERWLAEARIARDTLRLALPPSRAAGLAPGDVVRVDLGRGEAARWRIDRMERAGAATVEAVRVEAGVYRPVDTAEDALAPRRFVPPIPVWAAWLDLPLLRGDEVAHAPHLAVTATPWPGSVAAYSTAEAEAEGGWALNRVLTRPAIMGVTETPLAAARAGVIERGAPLRVRVKGGALRSVTAGALLAGANAMVIGDGTPDRWEVMQFTTAALIAPGLWELSGRLRGQAGTDALMPAVWPAGSVVVLLDGAPVQLDLAPGTRGQLRRWRVGPALRPLNDPSYREASRAFTGVGLRPLSPCHLRQEGRRLSWIRRTRIDGDGWDGTDVPLGESSERYLVRLVRAGERLAEAVVAAPEWEVPAAVWNDAAAGGAFAAEVAQLSEVWGAGPFARREIHA